MRKDIRLLLGRSSLHGESLTKTLELSGFIKQVVPLIFVQECAAGTEFFDKILRVNIHLITTMGQYGFWTSRSLIRCNNKGDKEMLRKLTVLSLVLVFILALAATAYADPGKPDFSPGVFADGEAYGLEIHFDGDQVTVNAKERTHEAVVSIVGKVQNSQKEVK